MTLFEGANCTEQVRQGAKIAPLIFFSFFPRLKIRMQFAPTYVFYRENLSAKIATTPNCT